jgi:hypothetical protein
MPDTVISRGCLALDWTDPVRFLADPAPRSPHIEIILQIEPELRRCPSALPSRSAVSAGTAVSSFATLSILMRGTPREGDAEN